MIVVQFVIAPSGEMFHGMFPNVLPQDGQIVARNGTDYKIKAKSLRWIQNPYPEHRHSEAEEHTSKQHEYIPQFVLLLT